MDGSLYGTTRFGGSNTGVVYRVTTNGAQSVLHRFGGSGDGQYPTAGLVDVGGTLYGTTSAGGASGDGTVYSITPSGEEKVLFSFGGPDGAKPWAPVINVNGTLYGTTDSGGAHRKGTVYSVNTKGVEKVLHSFAGPPTDGEFPIAGLINVNGTLYGTTQWGGNGCGVSHRCGAIFSITPSGEEKVVYSFGGPDGAFPHSSLIDVNGTLYGTTYGGGTYGDGTVYSITTQGKEGVLHDFGAANDGMLPQAGVIDVNGKLYGTTAAGGGASKDCRIGSGCGTVYSVTMSGVEQVLHGFTGGSDGGYPVANLIHVKGTLYGTTASPEVDMYDGISTVFTLTP
ncbi:MAG: hypothetical protein JOZ77_10565 [Candidatus Eremiobacteraeota bacterium]|nr:hypothetical protein [Candidatus Eremiobacteraeota bacterium]